MIPGQRLEVIVQSIPAFVRGPMFHEMRKKKKKNFIYAPSSYTYHRVPSPFERIRLENENGWFRIKSFSCLVPNWGIQSRNAAGVWKEADVVKRRIEGAIMGCKNTWAGWQVEMSRGRGNHLSDTTLGFLSTRNKVALSIGQPFSFGSIRIFNHMPASVWWSNRIFYSAFIMISWVSKRGKCKCWY